VIPTRNPNPNLTPKETQTDEIRITSKIKSMKTVLRSRSLIQPQCTPALSPSDGEREKHCRRGAEALSGDHSSGGLKRSLAPSDGERVRGLFDWIITDAKLDLSRPFGTCDVLASHPALKRWAIFDCAAGTEFFAFDSILDVGCWMLDVRFYV
jgi:hypothetical protein